MNVELNVENGVEQLQQNELANMEMEMGLIRMTKNGLIAYYVERSMSHIKIKAACSFSHECRKFNCKNK